MKLKYLYIYRLNCPLTRPLSRRKYLTLKGSAIELLRLIEESSRVLPSVFILDLLVKLPQPF